MDDPARVFFFFFTLVTGPTRSLSLKLSDTRVYEPQIRARLGTTTHFCEVVGIDLEVAVDDASRVHVPDRIQNLPISYLRLIDCCITQL